MVKIAGKPPRAELAGGTVNATQVKAVLDRLQAGDIAANLLLNPDQVAANQILAKIASEAALPVHVAAATALGIPGEVILADGTVVKTD